MVRAVAFALLGIGVGFGLLGLASLSLSLWGREPEDYLVQLFKREVHRDEYGILYTSLSTWGVMRFVKVGDSTGTYYLAVPRSMRTAKEAVAWTYDMRTGEFHPERV